MADITKCKGDGCPVKDKCYRYTAPTNPYAQSYFLNPPYNKETNSCTLYWGETQQEILTQLEEIVKPKKLKPLKTNKKNDRL